MNHREGNRASFFVKLCLKVNANRQNGPRTSIKDLIHFGEVVSYLRYTFPDGNSRLLTLIKMFDVKTNRDCLWSYKIKVINVGEIVSPLAVHLICY
ncbi:uncharacterized protein RHIMIDRAFT_126932 [Rhizopus microsporus ATCC 52813]|uniref:Uncharacterized protein n=1 Tax=Rhizopus microsporus ATCC 52813 TaxID=1340429 RepID=A0A2G4SW37_RHIZD|nr:uncharacterized protein RHIMIDRAFT_126932 [Rhizopus microsporus ATCC 52813]PHZ12965.1 hypothetical protein RHIMIDRAFT_126932 [Rhizopus microsporus ATCC 52813]